MEENLKKSPLFAISVILFSLGALVCFVVLWFLFLYSVDTEGSVSKFMVKYPFLTLSNLFFTVAGACTVMVYTAVVIFKRI